jgi:hypothetical protein
MSLLQQPWKIFVTLVFLTGVTLTFINPAHILTETSLIQGRQLTTVESFDSSVNFSADLKLLLNGDERKKDEAARWRAIHEAHPESPIHFTRSIQQSSTLPIGYRETVDSIAPENGWFDLFEISYKPPHLFEYVPPEEDDEDQMEDTLDRYQIIDEEGMKETLTLFHKAASKEEFTDYFIQLQEALQRELPEPKTWVSILDYVSKLATLSVTSEKFNLHEFTEVAFQYLQDQNDRQGFLQLVESSEKIAYKLLQDAHNNFKAVVFEGWLKSFYERAVIGCRHFNLPELEAKYLALEERLQLRGSKMSERRSSKQHKENWHLVKKHGGLLVQLNTGLNFSSKPEEITREDLRPSSRAESTIISRIPTIAWLAIFSILALPIWVITLRAPLEKKHEIRANLNASIRWKVLLIGVILPFALLLMIRYLTPLGQLDYSIYYASKSEHLTLPLIGFGLIIISTVTVVIRHLSECNRGFRFKDFLLILLPLGALLIIGTYHEFGRKSVVPTFTKLLLGISFLWLVIIGFRYLFSKKDYKYLKAHLALPAFLLGSGLFGIWTWALGQEERYWIARDDFGRPEAHFITGHEAQITRIYLAELEELLP